MNEWHKEFWLAGWNAQFAYDVQNGAGWVSTHSQVLLSLNLSLTLQLLGSLYPNCDALTTRQSLVLAHEGLKLRFCLAHVLSVLRVLIEPHLEAGLWVHHIRVIEDALETWLLVTWKRIIHRLHCIKLLLDNILKPVLGVGDIGAWLIRATALLVLDLNVAHFSWRLWLFSKKNL